MKKLLLLLYLSNTLLFLDAQIVNFTDTAFKSAVLNQGITIVGTDIDTVDLNLDGEIQITEAQAYSGKLGLVNQGIYNLDGIEEFINLSRLDFRSNDVSSVDLSNNTQLIYLHCANNNIAGVLDLTNNDSIRTLLCFYNEITEIKLDPSNSLTGIWCQGNQLDSLDGGNLTNLIKLFCFDNDLTYLNLENSDSLEIIQFHRNAVQQIVLPQNPINITQFLGQENQLNILDLTECASLVDIRINTNDLTSLNIANGINDSIIIFEADENPNLSCIQIDAGFTPPLVGWEKDSLAEYSDNCSSPILVNAITVEGQAGVSTITTNGGTLQMEASVLPANADDATYTWSVTNGTGAATIDANGLLTATADGTVDVTATANDASGTTGTKTITISNQSVGIKDLAFTNLSIFPNPTSGIINLNISEKLSSVKIMDLTGKTIKVFKPENTQLDISEFTTGIYFLEIANTERKSVVKIIKK